MNKINIHKNFNDLAKTCYNLDILNKSIETNLDELVTMSERMYHDQLRKVTNTITTGNYKMILVSGPSSSGKTTTSNFISKELLKKNIGSLVVSIDDFFVDLDDTPLLPDGTPDFENIIAVDVKAFNKFVSSLLTKRKARMPKFNFVKHKRDNWEEVSINDGDILIVEGIHSLNPDLITTHEFDNQIYKVYACVNSVFCHKDKIVVNEKDLRLMRRTYRDAFTRGRDPIVTLKQWKYVCDGEDKYITPFKCMSDIVIDTTHPYEIMIYSNYLKSLLMPFNKEECTKKIFKIFKNIKPLTKEFVPHNSLLWEFLVNKD